MDAVAQELLSKIPTGEELRDPRAGSYDNAILKEVGKSDDGLAMVLTFTGLRDQEGREFDYPHRVQFPGRQSEDWVKRIFLATLHDFGAVAREDKSARYVEDDATREAVVELFHSFVGTSYPIRLTESNSGFLNLRLLRPKKQ